MATGSEQALESSVEVGEAEVGKVGTMLGKEVNLGRI